MATGTEAASLLPLQRAAALLWVVYSGLPGGGQAFSGRGQLLLTDILIHLDVAILVLVQILQGFLGERKALGLAPEEGWAPGAGM